MSFWIPAPELNKEYMQKRETIYDNLYFSIFSTENLNVFTKTCFSKCVTDFTSQNISLSERTCLLECKNQSAMHQKNLFGYYSNMM